MRIKTSDKIMVPAILTISVLAPIVLVALLYLPQQYNFVGEQDAKIFPLFHAILNFTTALLLLLGYFFMKIQEIKWHRNTMITAFCLSVIFVVSYVISKTGHAPTHYGGEGIIKYIYYFILISHIILSAIIVPLVLFTIYRGLSGNIEKHRKIARWTFPIWFYVAVSGVLVYVFMAPYY